MQEQRSGAAGAAGVAGTAAGGVLPQRRILIVDEDPAVVRLLTEALQDAGHAVASATQSLRAFDRAKEARPDLILMALTLPYLNGLDQVKLFRLDGDLVQVPVILIGANRHALQGVEDPRALGIVDCLPKPLALERLLVTIERAPASI